MNYLSSLDKGSLKIIQTIGKQSDQRKMPAYMVGGVIRDVILGKKNLDFDIVFEGDAIALAKSLGVFLKAKATIYQPFGTATLDLPSGLRIDLATARKEIYPHPGALPVVAPGTLYDDLFRRDFTINSLAVSINKESFGHLVDKFGGLCDLKAKNIRVLHARSFRDDPTRILRAIRFEQRLKFNLEKMTSALLRDALKRGFEKTVHAQRYFEEFKKIFVEPDPVPCLRRLHHLKALDFISPLLKIDFSQIERIEKIFKLLARQKINLNQNEKRLIYFMVMLANLNNKALESILPKFNFTRAEKKSILQSRLILDIIPLLSAKGAGSQSYQLLMPFNRDVIVLLLVKPLPLAVKQRILRFLSRDKLINLEIDGHDLKKIGCSSGKKIGEILNRVLLEKIDDRVSGYREELDLAKRLMA